MQDMLARQPAAAEALRWAGLRLTPDAAPGTLEALLRLKALLLTAIALKRRSFKWYTKLPPEVRGAARCGAPCPLFWPPSPDWAVPGDDLAAAGALSPRLLRQPPSVLHSLRLAAADLALRLRHLVRQALRAVDWPAAGEGGEAPPGGEKRPAAAAAGAGSGVAAARGGSPGWARLRAQLRALRFAAQDWFECSWQVRARQL